MKCCDCGKKKEELEVGNALMGGVICVLCLEKRRRTK
jgi:hypothetical protein